VAFTFEFRLAAYSAYVSGVTPSQTIIWTCVSKWSFEADSDSSSPCLKEYYLHLVLVAPDRSELDTSASCVSFRALQNSSGS